MLFMQAVQGDRFDPGSAVRFHPSFPAVFGGHNVILIECSAFARALCDLIVVGSHSRHGLGLLVGSTTDSVLHSAGCDVLAIHLKDE